MTTLFLHEGEPGHHFQISLAQENAALPAFMRFGGNTAFVEGWALYAETLGYDMGLYKDPYQRFGTLNDEMLRAMRLVVDTGIHTKGWTREQAIDYMLANSGMGRTDATAEVERYIAIPGQATAYKIGALTIQRLRRKAEAELGDQVRHPRLPRPGAEQRRAAAVDPRRQDRPLDRAGEGRAAAKARPARHADSRLGRGQRLGDQLAAVVDAVKGDEAAHARALAGAEQGFVQRLEPAAQAFERMALADLEHLGLDVLGGRVAGQLGKLGVEIAQCLGLHRRSARGASARARRNRARN